MAKPKKISKVILDGISDGIDSSSIRRTISDGIFDASAVTHAANDIKAGSNLLDGVYIPHKPEGSIRRSINDGVFDSSQAIYNSANVSKAGNDLVDGVYIPYDKSDLPTKPKQRSERYNELRQKYRGESNASDSIADIAINNTGSNRRMTKDEWKQAYSTERFNQKWSQFSFAKSREGFERSAAEASKPFKPKKPKLSEDTAADIAINNIGSNRKMSKDEWKRAYSAERYNQNQKFWSQDMKTSQDDFEKSSAHASKTHKLTQLSEDADGQLSFGFGSDQVTNNTPTPEAPTSKPEATPTPKPENPEADGHQITLEEHAASQQEKLDEIARANGFADFDDMSKNAKSNEEVEAWEKDVKNFYTGSRRGRKLYRKKLGRDPVTGRETLLGQIGNTIDTIRNSRNARRQKESEMEAIIDSSNTRTSNNDLDTAANINQDSLDKTSVGTVLRDLGPLKTAGIIAASGVGGALIYNAFDDDDGY